MVDEKKVKVVDKRTGEVSWANSSTFRKRYRDENPDGQKIEGKDSSAKYESILESSSSIKEEAPASIKKVVVEKKAPKKKQEKIEINCLADYIRYAYSRKGQNLRSLSSAEIKDIAKNARLEDRQLTDLLAESQHDALLAVPRQIVFAVKKIGGSPQVQQETRKFLSEVLKRHPIYKHNNLLPVISNLVEAVQPVEAIRTLARLSQDTLSTLTGLKQPKHKDAETLRSNAIYTLAIWVWESRNHNVDRIIRWLYDGYWSIVSDPEKNPAATLQIVTAVSDVSGVGAACAHFKAEADAYARTNMASKQSIERLNTELENRKTTIDGLQERILTRDKKIEELSHLLEIERSSHANTRAHLDDELEHLRSNVVRRLTREISLLAEGIQALRRDPPKVHVMDDHAERVLEGLNAAMKAIR